MKLISPVFAKELLQVSNNRQIIWTKSLFLGILMVDIVIFMYDMPVFNTYHAAQSGRSLFGNMSVVAMLAVLLFTPVFTAGVVSGEREADTLVRYHKRLLKVRVESQTKLVRRTFKGVMESPKSRKNEKGLLSQLP